MNKHRAERLSIHSFEQQLAPQRAPRTVCVMGLGYIGLPTASILAERGHRVFGVDVRPEIVAAINRGQIHIHEPHLDELVARVTRDGDLTAATEPSPADVFVLCVPTPTHPDMSADVSYVEAAARAIRPHVRRGSLIILESTSPPGTTENIVVPHAVPDGWKVGRDVFVAHCPERVIPGRILREVVENDRIVGGVTPACTEQIVAFYKTFVTGDVLATNAKAAETTKLVENSFRDVNIAFANELSMLCEHLSLDVYEIIELANRHPRVNILDPGPGVGGHCISVDPWFLVHAAPQHTPLIRQAREVNNHKPEFVLSQIERAARSSRARVIGCLGLAYKADVDDLRESPSLEIVRHLHQRGEYEILACEPYVPPSRFSEFPLASLDEVLRRSDLLVLLTDHTQFKNIPYAVLQTKTLVDTRGTWRNTLREGGLAESQAQPKTALRAA